MTTSIIVAAAKNGVIGNKGQIPWHLPGDWAYFKRTTLGHPIIMGQVTHDSIGRVLPGRQNIVLSDDPNYKPAEGAVLATSFDQALKLAGAAGEVFICGGSSVYEQALPLADKIYLTRVHLKPEGDRTFEFDESQWREVSRQENKADAKNQYDYDFLVFERRSK